MPVLESVSSTPVVLNAKLLDQLRCTQTKEVDEMRRNLKTVRLFPSGAQALNSCRSIDYVGNNQSIVFVPMIYAGQWKICQCQRKSTHLCSCAQQTTYMPQIQSYRHTRNASGRFYSTAWALTLASEIMLQRFLCKSFRSCGIYNSLFRYTVNSL